MTFRVNLRRALAALFLAGVVSQGIPAQAQKHDPASAAQTMSDEMKAELSLSEEQFQKVSVINQDFTKEMAELRNADGDRREKIGRMRDLKEKRETALQAVLDKDQFNRFKAYQKENRKAMRAQRGNNRSQEE